MPDEARKQWLREELNKADYCHLGSWGDDKGWSVDGDLLELLDENDRLLAANERLKESVAALVAYVKAANEELSQEQAMGLVEAYQALSDELREEIDA